MLVLLLLILVLMLLSFCLFVNTHCSYWCICGNAFLDGTVYSHPHIPSLNHLLFSAGANTQPVTKGVKNALRVDIDRQTMTSMIAKIVPWECIKKNKAASFAWIVCQVL